MARCECPCEQKHPDHRQVCSNFVRVASGSVLCAACVRAVLREEAIAHASSWPWMDSAVCEAFGEWIVDEYGDSLVDGERVPAMAPLFRAWAAQNNVAF